MSAAAFARLAPAPGFRLALVGGAGGLGRRLAEVAAAIGLAPAVLDLPAALADAPPPPGLPAFPVDVTDPATLAAAFGALAERWAALDGLVYLSGYALIPPRPLAEVGEGDWARLIEVNLTGAFRAFAAARPLLARAEAPAVVTVSSTLGAWVMPGFGPYAASKAGLEALTKAIALEGAPGLRANAVAPSAMATPFVTGGTGRAPEPGAEAWFEPARFAAPIPLGRLAEVDDVLGPILFLLGPGSRFMTGQVLVVSGGRHLG